MNLKQIEIISEAKGIKIKDLAERVPIAFSGLYRSIKENSIKASTLERVSEILEVPISVFFGVNSDSEKEIIELKKQISTLETLLADRQEISTLQKNMLDILMLEKKRLNIYMNALNSVAKTHTELMNHPVITEIVKLNYYDPNLMESIKDMLQDNPEALEEYKEEEKRILNLGNE